jgi:hypothetical protein
VLDRGWETRRHLTGRRVAQNLADARRITPHCRQVEIEKEAIRRVQDSLKNRRSILPALELAARLNREIGIGSEDRVRFRQASDRSSHHHRVNAEAVLSRSVRWQAQGNFETGKTLEKAPTQSQL